jgi:hypothetical protein
MSRSGIREQSCRHARNQRVALVRPHLPDQHASDPHVPGREGGQGLVLDDVPRSRVPPQRRPVERYGIGGPLRLIW